MLPANQDGGRGGWGGASQGAAGAEDGGPEENLHQVDEQRLLQERGETGREEKIWLIWPENVPATAAAKHYFQLIIDSPADLLQSLYFINIYRLSIE